MIRNLKVTLGNAYPVLRISFFSWIKSKRFLILEKRLIVVGFFLLLTLVIQSKNISDSKKTVSPQKRNENLIVAQNKIKGGEWKIVGIGNGQDIADLPKIKAGAVINVEDGKVLWSKNIEQKISPASLSKLATSMVALDLEKLDKQIEVSKEASEQTPTKLGLKTGEKLRLDEAISATILTSANDAAETIASSIGKSIGGNGTDDFMDLVNIKLERLGAKNSHFTTATGLDEEQHFSTVADLAIIGREAYKNYPYISEVAAQTFKRLEPNSSHKVFDLPNWNALLGTYPGVNGLKIGYTENSGHSTLVTANQGGVNLMAIVIGANSIENREIAAASLLNYGFSNYGIDPFPLSQLDLIKRFEDWRRQLSLATN